MGERRWKRRLRKAEDRLADLRYEQKMTGYNTLFPPSYRRQVDETIARLEAEIAELSPSDG